MSLEKLEKKAKKASEKAQKARDKLPKKRRIKVVRSFDEKSGKAKIHLCVEKKNKSVKESIIKKSAKKAVNAVAGEVHEKIAQVENENDAVKATHKTEQTGEEVVRYIKYNKRNRYQKKLQKVRKLNKKEVKTNSKYQYKKFLEENPQYKHDVYKKWQNKKNIQKAYKQKIKEEMMQGTKTTFTALKEFIGKKKSIFVGVAIFSLLFFMISASLGSCAAMMSGGQSITMATSYSSEPMELEQVENRFTELELELQKNIDNVERDHPDYDEYRYNISPIGHDPFLLINYLSAEHTIFTYSGVQSEIQTIFDEMYTLSFRHVQETRTRTETRTGHRTIHHEDGTTTEEDYEYEVEVEYTVDILETVLTVKAMDNIATENLTSGQKILYDAYSYTHGGLQQLASPLDLYWYNYITSYYGHRKNPNTSIEEFHKGLDIGAPDGSKIYAALDGSVVDVGTDSYFGKYLKIKNADGMKVTYSHLSEVSVLDGQAVSKGDILGKTGHSGTCNTPHLHLEVEVNGIQYNPLFYFNVTSTTLFREGPSDTPDGITPPEYYDDETARKILEEAAKYLGYPYVWGGSNPSTSFDCSGFVCWVFNNSGVKSFARTTAQGLYNMSTPISSSDAKPGDLVFFTGTYNSGTTVTHVGIYCGGNVFIHCGDPIKYANLSSPYWTGHFYSFGRL